MLKIKADRMKDLEKFGFKKQYGENEYGRIYYQTKEFYYYNGDKDVKGLIVSVETLYDYDDIDIAYEERVLYVQDDIHSYIESLNYTFSNIILDLIESGMIEKG